MSSRRRFANLAVLATLATLTAACSIEDIASALAENSTIGIRDVKILPHLTGSGVSGEARIYAGPPATLLVEIEFPAGEPYRVGAKYPVHIHPGLRCGGGDIPITHDLVAPASRAWNEGTSTVRIEGGPFPIEHVSPGYSVDVHAPNDPTGVPLACGVF
jgi:hypothetical protein